MNKEEILNASRNENQDKDLAKIAVESKGVKFAMLGTLILTTIYYVLEIVVKGVTNYGWYSIIGLFCTLMYGYRAIKLKNTFDIVVSVVWLLATASFIYTYVSYIFTSSTIL